LQRGPFMLAQAARNAAAPTISPKAVRAGVKSRRSSQLFV